jgi:malate synthase
MKVFDENMPTKNQMHIKRSELNITEEQLLELPKGTITENGVRKNINVGILYLESWLNGSWSSSIIQFNGRCCNSRNFEKHNFGYG